MIQYLLEFQENWEWYTGKHTEKIVNCFNSFSSYGSLGKNFQCFGMHCSEYILVHTFALGIKSSPSERFMDELHEPFEHLILHVIRNIAANKNRSTVNI